MLTHAEVHKVSHHKRDGIVLARTETVPRLTWLFVMESIQLR